MVYQPDLVYITHLLQLTLPILRNLEMGFVDAFDAKDAKAAAALYQESGVMLKGGAVVGGNRAEIKSFLRSVMDAGARNIWCTEESSAYDAVAAHWVERSKFGYALKGVFLLGGLRGVRRWQLDHHAGLVSTTAFA